MQIYDVVIMGAGAAGLMCGIEAGKRGRSVLILDRANMPGKKILMSGGGRCNFTNSDIGFNNYLSRNPHFMKSALKRYTQWDFIELVNRYKIAYHEKTKGQLFCDNKSKDILTMLLAENEKYQTKILLNIETTKISQTEKCFKILTAQGMFAGKSLVIATGGLSIPTLGASPFAYQIAKEFGLNVWPTRAGLVPLTFTERDKYLAKLSGIAMDVIVENAMISFHDPLLFTHRGLSGPAILQISSYAEERESININFLPDIFLQKVLQEARQVAPNKTIKNILYGVMPKRVVEVMCDDLLYNQRIAEASDAVIEQIAAYFHHWKFKPNGTEGYRTAEVTLGGVDCNELSSQTMQATKVSGLYFIGEAVDVTGWLGGYNFQWAWSSGWAAGQAV